MKKQIISLAIAAIALTSFTSFARTKGNAAACCNSTLPAHAPLLPVRVLPRPSRL